VDRSPQGKGSHDHDKEDAGPNLTESKQGNFVFRESSNAWREEKNRSKREKNLFLWNLRNTGGGSRAGRKGKVATGEK